MLLPAAKDVGAAEFVTTRSAWVAVATTSAAVAVLFDVLGSVTAELTLAVSLIAVPAAVPAFTFSTTVNVPEPAARLGFVQVIVPVPFTAGVMHDHPAGAEIDWNVVFAGVLSVRLAVVAVLGPLLVTTCVYVMLLPACTGTGLAVFVIARSAESATCTVAVAELLVEFGSVVGAALTESVSVIVVLDAVPGFTFTTNVNVAEVFAAKLAMLQTYCGLLKVHVHPAGPVIET